ncbi:putative TetR family transcriptional regulator [Rhodococcus erythropolis PR4]|uniref:Putative TetR family transcriptional regulator n=1 Tax=Rhodococcus erythropolis (strain PR4 / NBRC 100887) TaxID=234621 RepID=C0ZQ29_RHOE4|nr:putative TetR family transcriptional regulator [Rhodococcus erythropolis PR4]
MSGARQQMSTIVSKEQYFETALDVLAEVGFKGLNIRRMCQTLGVTTGSFYHYFGNWQGFVDALFEYWEHRQDRILRNLAFGTGGPEDDIAALRTLTLGLPHAAEAAIRAWGMNDTTVHEVQRRVDSARRKTVGSAIARVVDSEDTAEVVVSLGMAMLVGFQSLTADGQHSEFVPLLDEYLRLVYMHGASE